MLGPKVRIIRASAETVRDSASHGPVTHTPTVQINAVETVADILRQSPGKDFDLNELHAALVDRGWTTSAKSVRGVIANTVNKAREKYGRDVIDAPRRGLYRWVTPSSSEDSLGEADAHTPSVSAVPDAEGQLHG
jgi:hypothetical protein